MLLHAQRVGVAGRQEGLQVLLDVMRHAQPLHPGMLLEADILGERRRLYEWLLEPLYALRGLDA